MEPITVLTFAAFGFLAPVRPITQIDERILDPDPIVDSSAALSRYQASDLMFGAGTSMTEVAQVTLSEVGEVYDPRGAIARELYDYLALDNGWDGEDSYAPDLKSINAAKRLLDLLPGGLPLPSPMLSTEGEVGLYWKLASGFADVVVHGEGHFSLFAKRKGLGAEEEFLDSVPITSAARQLIADKLSGLLAERNA